MNYRNELTISENVHVIKFTYLFKHLRLSMLYNRILRKNRRGEIKNECYKKK